MAAPPSSWTAPSVLTENRYTIVAFFAVLARHENARIAEKYIAQNSDYITLLFNRMVGLWVVQFEPNFDVDPVPDIKSRDVFLRELAQYCNDDNFYDAIRRFDHPLRCFDIPTPTYKETMEKFIASSLE